MTISLKQKPEDTPILRFLVILIETLCTYFYTFIVSLISQFVKLLLDQSTDLNEQRSEYKSYDSHQLDKDVDGRS